MGSELNTGYSESYEKTKHTMWATLSVSESYKADGTYGIRRAISD
jgi:hypothetical protein